MYLTRANFMLLATMFMVPALSHAAPAYTVTPLVIDEAVEARDIKTFDITLTNIGTQQVTVFPSVNNISLSSGGTIEEFIQPVMDDRTRSLTAWTEINRLGISLAVGESKTILLTLRINPNPVPGTYHEFIGFGYGRNRDEAEAQVRTGQAPGTVVTVTVEDNTVSFLKLSKFIVKRFIMGGENQAAVYTFSNPGDEVVTPRGEIIFFNSSGEEVGSIAVNSENMEIAPGEAYTFTGEVPTDGLFGKYKAFLSVEYGNRERGAVQDTSFFYVFPLQYMLAILAFLVALASFGAWHTHRKYFDEQPDDSVRLTLHRRDTMSGPRPHDLDLTKS